MSRSWLRLQFTFTHPDDVKEYGDQPYLYDEAALAALPARDLAALEEQFGQTVVSVINGVRESQPMADLAVTWWALSQVREMPPIDEYNPHTLVIEWERAPADLGKDPAPEMPLLDLDPADTTVLPSLPKVG